ncbi:hypothetical protein ACIO3M_39775, partial [Streptomyces erythrochromogenes]
MHDARALIEMGAEAVRRLARRGYSLDLSRLDDGSGAGSGDRFSHAARRAGVVMTVSYSMGVRR